MIVRTRFAPSPTGVLHIGSVRTALFCWLYARHCGGEFVLRIEDTDRERSTQASVDTILDGMNWLGLQADGEPVYQSERFERHRAVVASLLDAGKAYHCDCSRERLDDLRQTQRSKGEKTRYDGHCRDRGILAGVESAVVRFRNPEDGVVEFDDGVKGPVRFENSELDDLVILRADDSPTYNFSVVVDDADMEISHVIRGDDHLNNTPRQINLYHALGWQLPHFSHLPMIHGEDGAKLSKRHGAVNVLDYREQGYLPAALLNYLVRLGWSHGDQEIFSADELIRLFDIHDVNKSASTFNAGKLDWVNQQYLISSDPQTLIPIFKAQLQRLGLQVGKSVDLIAVIAAFRERASTLAELAEQSAFCFVDVPQLDPKAAKKHLRPVALELMELARERLAAITDWNIESLSVCIEELATERGVGLGKIGQPLRVAITGGGASPGIGETLALVGSERSLRRLDGALDFIRQRVEAAG